MQKQTYLDVQKQLDFTSRSLWLQGAQDVAFLLAAGVLLYTRSIAGVACAQLVLACFYFRAFSMMHEAVHRTVSKNTRVNNWAGVLYGGFCFLPFTTWQALHRDHHFWVGNVEKDPVMRMVRQFPLKSDRHKAFDTFFWRTWIPYVALLQEIVFWVVSAKIIVENKQFEKRRGELFASLVTPLLMAGALLAGGWVCGSVLLLLPSIPIYLAMVEIVNFPHHLRLPRLQGGSQQLPLWQQYLVSRTCVYSPWVARYVLLNFNYHAEHHMFPTLPWHQLPLAHKLVKAVQPVGYQECRGHEWILENRRENLSVVFAPTSELRPDEAAAA